VQVSCPAQVQQSRLPGLRLLCLPGLRLSGRRG
jgi:hypothetical protein